MPLKILKLLTRFALAEEGSVKTRVVRSGMWVGAANIVGSVLSIVRSVVLARLLTPEMFGLMGLAGVAIRAIETMTRPGIAQALISRPQAFQEAAATAFTMLILRGFLLAAVLAVAAPWVSAFYEASELEPVLQVLSFTFLIGGFSNINAIAYQKELDFRRLTYLGLTTTVLGTIVTIAAAFWLRNVWALVFGQLATTGLSSLLSYYFLGGKLELAWNSQIARELLGYGKFITGSSIVLFIAAELDSVVIGKLLGVEQLGYYTLAFTIANALTTNLSKIASSIMMPAYSKLQSDRPALRRAYLRTLSLVMFVVLPATVGILFAAEPLVVVIYGEKWLSAVLPLQILAAFGLVRALASLSGYLFEGIGLPKVALQLGLWRLLMISPLIVPMTSEFGLEGAAVTMMIGITVQWLIGLVYLRGRLEIHFSEVLSSCWRAIWTSSAMAIVAFGIMRIVPYNTLIGLAAVVLGAVAVYVMLNFTFLKELKRAHMA